jgi:hypothetical protein
MPAIEKIRGNYLMSFITDLARQGKDRALSRTLEALSRQFVGRYGTLSDIRLDSRERKIELELLLKGESTPVRIFIQRYDILSEEEKSYIVCRDITVSREWMKALAEDFLREKKFEIPHKYAKFLEAII